MYIESINQNNCWDFFGSEGVVSLSELAKHASIKEMQHLQFHRGNLSQEHILENIEMATSLLQSAEVGMVEIHQRIELFRETVEQQFSSWDFANRNAYIAYTLEEIEEILNSTQFRNMDLLKGNQKQEGDWSQEREMKDWLQLPVQISSSPQEVLWILIQDCSMEQFGKKMHLDRFSSFAAIQEHRTQAEFVTLGLIAKQSSEELRERIRFLNGQINLFQRVGVETLQEMSWGEPKESVSLLNRFQVDEMIGTLQQAFAG